MLGRYRKLWGTGAVLVVWAAVRLPAARADVVVLANHTAARVTAEIKPVTDRAFTLTLPVGDVVPVFSDGRVRIEFSTREGTKRYLLDANSAYFFGVAGNGRLDLQKIGLGDDATSAQGRPLPGSASSAPIGTIPVKILVDEEEPAKQIVWERQLRKRIDAASDILEKHCKLRLKVVAVGTWNSDNKTTDFFEALTEFEHEVNAFPARVAIGFTNQYHAQQGRIHLAGTRGPLQQHILIREWAQHVSEPERLELLVHELGHFLGASHSPESNSVMRPVLGDRQVLHAGFQIRFDPVNTLIMSLIGEEIRRRGVQDFSALTPGTKRRLRQIYGALSLAYPEDPASHEFVHIVDVATVSPLVSGTRTVLQEIVRSAYANHNLPLAGEAAPGQQARRVGDQLTEFYVRQAAQAAESLPVDVGPSALLLALGIGLDDSDALAKVPKTQMFVNSVESSGQSAVRRVLLGEPTMRGRRDLIKHFVLSAYLTVVLGSDQTNAVGLAKEMDDIRRGSGFSFADLAANHAGIAFAGNVLSKRLSLPMLAKGFAVELYMPSVDGLREQLSAVELAADFGGQEDDRFQRRLHEVDERVLALPPYRLSGPPADHP
jgi:Matrixin